MRFTFLLCSILLISSALFAQNQDQKSDNQPNYQITVTADRLEESVAEKTDAVTIITRDEIEAHQWSYVVDALRQVPGLSLVQSGSPGKTTSVFLRGAGSAQVLVMLDGIPINNPYFGGVNFEDLTTDNIERIEVLKGPQSPLYGSDSIGGVIQIISRKGTQGNQFHAAFEGGSFNTYRENAGLHGGQRNADYSVTFSRNDTNGQTDNDEFRENVINGNANFRVSDATKISALAQVYDSQIGLPIHFLFDPVTFATYVAPSPLQNQTSNLALTGVTLQHNAGQYVNLNGTFSYNHRNFHYEDPGTFSPFANNHSGVSQFTLQNDSYITDKDKLSFGYEFEHQAINADDQTGQYLDEVIKNNSLFIQNKLETNTWIATAGFRWDHYNTFGNTVNPRVGIAYKFPENWKVRASFGTGFRAPTAGDLALPFYGNPDLQPEKSQSWEIGSEKYWGNRFAMSASYFHNHYNDLITFDPNTFIAGNVAKASAQGIELSGDWHAGVWSVGGDYTYLKTKDEITGLRLYRRPKHLANIRVSYNGKRWGSSFSMQSVGDRLETDFVLGEDVLNPAYAKFDAAAYYQLTHSIRLKGRIENFTDKDYEEALYYKAPGIGFFGGMEATF